MGGAFITIAFFACVLLQRLFVGWFDRRRIRFYFTAVGSTVTAIVWRPYSQLWGEYFTRTYEVRFRDINGQEHCALYRTNRWLGTWKYSPLSELRTKT